MNRILHVCYKYRVNFYLLPTSDMTQCMHSKLGLHLTGAQQKFYNEFDV